MLVWLFSRLEMVIEIVYKLRTKLVGIESRSYGNVELFKDFSKKS